MEIVIILTLGLMGVSGLSISCIALNITTAKVEEIELSEEI